MAWSIHYANERDEDWDGEYPGGLDLYEVLEEADKLFVEAQIRPSRNEQIALVAMTDKGKVVGAATLGLSPEDAGIEGTFSVVVAPRWRRKGIARALVEAVIEQGEAEAAEAGEEGLSWRVWVVNPHMALLLESMGFWDDGPQGWSELHPHMFR